MTMVPGRIWPGAVKRIYVDFRDVGDTLVNPATVTLYLQNPCGTESSFVYGSDDEIGRSATGKYYADITPDMGGLWRYRWLTTGAGTVFAIEGDMLVSRSPFVDDLQPDAYRD